MLIHQKLSALLAQMAISAVMFWSYVPLISLGITAVAFAVKVPIEVCSGWFCCSSQTDNQIPGETYPRQSYRSWLRAVPEESSLQSNTIHLVNPWCDMLWSIYVVYVTGCCWIVELQFNFVARIFIIIRHNQYRRRTSIGIAIMFEP
jgi:hypothetical protein